MQNADDHSFYRVTSRALILVDNKLVLVKGASGDWQVPGGGWEQDESFEACVSREVLEELGVVVKTVGPLLFSYRQQDRRGYTSLRLAAKVVTNSTNFTALDGMQAVETFTKDEFSSMQLCPGEGPVQDYIDIIWQD